MDFLIGLLVGAGATWAFYQYQRVKSQTIRQQFSLKDHGNQLRFLEEAKLSSQAPINKEAYQTFKAIEEYLKTNAPSLRVFAEVGLGAFIRTDENFGSPKQRSRAFSSFNSKRVDFLIIDWYGKPILAVEHHGSGHNQTSNTAARDAVKKRALEMAGIPLIETRKNSSKDELIVQLNAHLKRAVSL